MNVVQTVALTDRMRLIADRSSQCPSHALGIAKHVLMQSVPRSFSRTKTSPSNKRLAIVAASHAECRDIEYHVFQPGHVCSTLVQMEESEASMAEADISRYVFAKTAVRAQHNLLTYPRS